MPTRILQASALVLLLATISHARTINAASCSRADVGTAITASTYGDTVLVPAGTCTWSSSLMITKNIVFAGAGSPQTIIRTGSVGSHLIIYRPDSTSVNTNGRFELYGMTIDLANTPDGGVWLNNETSTPIDKVLIHDMVFSNLGGGGTSLSNACLSIGENGDVYGVAYSNTFSNCKVVGRNYGRYQTSWNSTAFVYGSPNNFYWEDNIFTGNSAFHFGGHGGRYASRFNSYMFTTGDWEVVWDVHGNQTGGVYGTMGCEIHHNTVSLARGTTVVDHRGGSCMVFSNTVTGSSGSWQVREEYADSLSPTTNAQPQHVSNSYYFQNTQSGIIKNLSETQDCCSAISENAQYWNQASPFNGMTGVGVGKLSARPTTCTVGVGYWATDQGEWNAKNAEADGQFYKCTATNTWSLYYRPYSYPHPLRAGSTGPPSDLSASAR